MYHLGLWKKYSAFPFLSKDTESLAAQTFLTANRVLWSLVTRYFAYYFPSVHSRHNAIPKPVGHQLGSFAMVALNLDLKTLAHRDKSDCFDGMAVIIPFGNWSGGNLRLHELGLEVQSRPSDLTFFDSHNITHSVSDIIGTRNVALLFSHQSLFDFYGV